MVIHLWEDEIQWNDEFIETSALGPRLDRLAAAGGGVQLVREQPERSLNNLQAHVLKLLQMRSLPIAASAQDQPLSVYLKEGRFLHEAPDVALDASTSLGKDAASRPAEKRAGVSSGFLFPLALVSMALAPALALLLHHFCFGIGPLPPRSRSVLCYNLTAALALGTALMNVDLSRVGDAAVGIVSAIIIGGYIIASWLAAGLGLVLHRRPSG